MRLSLGGRPFRIIGSDGGLLESPVTVTETLLTRGDRVELAVGPFEDEGAEISHGRAGNCREMVVGCLHEKLESASVTPFFRIWEAVTSRIRFRVLPRTTNRNSRPR